MKAFRLQTFAAGLTIVGLLGMAAEISVSTAVAAKNTKAKANTSSNGTDRRAKVAAASPGKLKPSVKFGTSATSKRRTKSKVTANRSVLTADITTNGRTRTIRSLTASVSVLRRAAAAKRRAGKTGKTDDTFKAVVNLNGVRFEFTDPAIAERACRKLAKVLFLARKERIFLGDIGQIEPADIVASEALPTSGADSTPSPKAKKKRRRMSQKQRRQAAVQANARRFAVRRALQLRINTTIQMAVRKNRGRRLSQSQIQHIVQTEIEEARKGGLIPAGAQNSGLGGIGSANSGNREAHIRTYRRQLGHAFAEGKRLDAKN